MKKAIINIFAKNLKKVDINEISKLKIDLRVLTIENIKQILKKPPDKRTNEDIAYLKNFVLFKTKFADKLMKENIEDQAQEVMMILSMPSAEIKIIKNKGEIIYDINEESKYFYIILSGKVEEYSIEKIDREINGEQYYKLIMNYRKNKERYLLEKTLKENKVNIPIDIKDVNRLDKILLKIFLTTKKGLNIYKENEINYLDVIFEKLGFKYSDFNILSYDDNLNKINSTENTPEEAKKLSRIKEQKLLDYINSEVPDFLCKKYLFLIKTPEIPVTYYQYKRERVLNELDYFGDSHSGIYKNRLKSFSNNLELLSFTNDNYNEYFLNIKTTKTSTINQFLLNNFFFNSIYKQTFEKVYLKYFEYKKFYSNQIILAENEPLTHIYFIKSGNVKLFSTRSVIQSHILIQLLINIIKQKCPHITYENENFKNYEKIKVDFDKIRDKMNLNKSIHIMNIDEKQCIGYECFYFGFCCLYTAIAFSEKVEVYKISIDNLFDILSIKNKNALYDFAIQAEKALKILLDRLITVNSILITTYDQIDKNLYKKTMNIMEKEILLNQQKFEEKIGIANIKNVLIKEQKKVDQNFLASNNNTQETNDIRKKYISFSCPRRKTIRYDMKKYNLIKNKLIEKLETAKNKNKRLENLALTAKLFDYRANLLRQRNREMLRERLELGRLSIQENKKINYLKLQNRISSDFVQFSKGEKRIFINSRSSDNFEINSIKHFNNFKKRKIIIKNKNKMTTLIPILNKEINKREFFPNLNKREENNNSETNNIIKVYKNGIVSSNIKRLEYATSYNDVDINDRGKIYSLKRSTEGTSSTYKSIG